MLNGTGLLQLRITILFTLVAIPVSASFPEICVKCWYEVPNSNLSAVFQEPAPPPHGEYGQGNITGGWNGAVFDLKRNRLIIAGHGSGDNYAGNEVYAFDLDSLKWIRIKDAASEYDEADTLYAYYKNGGAVPDSQQPRPGSTFDAMEYDTTTNSLYILGMPYAYSHRTAFQNIHRLQLDSLTWSHPADVNSDIGYGGSVSARDPSTGKIWILGNGQGAFMSSFTPGTGTITDHGDYNFFEELTSGHTAAIMPSTNRFISLGGSEAFYWDLVSSGETERKNLSTTGCDSLINANGPGLEWSKVDRKLIGWAGGTHVFTMDSTYMCADIAPGAGNIATPDAPENNGTYGRWRYVPKHNVFIVVNSTTGNVFLYRHSAAPGDTVPPDPVIEILSPVENALTNQGNIAVDWKVDGVTQTMQTSEALEMEGSNLVIRCSGVVCDTVSVIRDQTPPAVAITSPAHGAILHDEEVAVAWEVDGVPQSIQLSEELEPGANSIVRGATDAAGNTAHDTMIVNYSLDPPVVVIVSPVQGAEILSTPATVSWTVDGVAQDIQLTESLQEGVNLITRQSTYAGGSQSVSASVTIYFDSQPEECLDP